MDRLATLTDPLACNYDERGHPFFVLGYDDFKHVHRDTESMSLVARVEASGVHATTTTIHH